MISQILQRLEALQTELSTIDPAQDLEAADKVATIASALRRALDEAPPSARADAFAARDVSARRAA